MRGVGAPISTQGVMIKTTLHALASAIQVTTGPDVPDAPGAPAILEGGTVGGQPLI
jgi:hypothetical protein